MGYAVFLISQDVRVHHIFDRFIRNLPRATEAKKLTKTLRPTLLTPKLEKLSENDRQLFI